MSNREDIVNNIIAVLEDMDHPKPTFVTREPFDVLKLAITQFPAVLVTTGNEIREDHAMGGARRGVMQIQIRGFVRADGRSAQIITVDQKRNELIERELNASRAATTQVSSIEVIDRTPPLGEFLMTAAVSYSFTKGAT